MDEWMDGWMAGKRKRLMGEEGLWPESALAVEDGDLANTGVEPPPSDPLSLILSSHDRERPAPVLHPLCMDELYCIMFF